LSSKAAAIQRDGAHRRSIEAAEVAEAASSTAVMLFGDGDSDQEDEASNKKRRVSVGLEKTRVENSLKTTRQLIADFTENLRTSYQECVNKLEQLYAEQGNLNGGALEQKQELEKHLHTAIAHLSDPVAKALADMENRVATSNTRSCLQDLALSNTSLNKSYKNDEGVKACTAQFGKQNVS
jgi:hypothetical protein